MLYSEAFRRRAQEAFDAVAADPRRREAGRESPPDSGSFQQSITNPDDASPQFAFLSGVSLPGLHDALQAQAEREREALKWGGSVPVPGGWDELADFASAVEATRRKGLRRWVRISARAVRPRVEWHVHRSGASASLYLEDGSATWEGDAYLSPLGVDVTWPSWLARALAWRKSRREG